MKEKKQKDINVVEVIASLDPDEECVYDQGCIYAHRVGYHSSYCHNEEWEDAPRKCNRGAEWMNPDNPQFTCPGYKKNPNANPKYYPEQGED